MSTLHAPRLAQGLEWLDMSMLCALKKELHHLIAWLCLVSHSLPLFVPSPPPPSPSTFPWLCRSGPGLNPGSATPPVSGLSGRMADDAATTPPQELGDEGTVPKLRRSRGSPRWRCETRLRLLCRILGAGLVSITNDDRKSSERSCQPNWIRDSLDALDEQVTPYPQTVKVKMEDAPMLLRLPRSEFLERIRLPTVQIGERLGRLPKKTSKNCSFLWKGNCTERTFCRIAVGKTVRKNFYMKNGWEEAPTWEVLCVLLTTCTWDGLKRERKANDILVDEYSKMFESRISAAATEKVGRFCRSERACHGVVLRHGGTCTEMLGMVLRICKTKNIKQLYTKFPHLVSTTASSRNRNWKRLEMSKFALTSSWNVFIWRAPADLTFSGL